MTDRDQGQAVACRRLWASVILAVFNDSWTAIARDPDSKDRLRVEALLYFSSRDGKDVTALAGITADPARLADAAVDLTARDRTKAAFGLEDRA